MNRVPSPPRSFTVQFDGRVNELKTKAHIFMPLNPDITPLSLEVIESFKEYTCIWDTGATHSVISQVVVNECGLKPIGMAKVHSATDIKDCETYLVSISLPNKVIFPQVRVTNCVLTGFEVLIGMDIINQGDFAITHNDGKTLFSFRLPSMEKIDFVDQKKDPAHSTKISRNSSCPCGSGKKYKKCCGINTI